MARRCAYREEDQRCTRNGFGNPPLCRPHAVQASLDGRQVDLPGDSPIFGWIQSADRILSRSNVEIVKEMRDLFGEYLAGAAHARMPPPRQQAAPPAQARVMEDPRSVLGIEPGTKITKEIIRDRKKALAAIFHPDRPGGSLKAMKRVNEAADKLLCSL